MPDARVNDAEMAQAAARRYLAAKFGADKVKTVAFSMAWCTQGSTRDLWEVEGDAVIKKAWFRKDNIHFRVQVDPLTGRVIAFEF
jgi:hypothetical protein